MSADAHCTDDVIACEGPCRFAYKYVTVQAFASPTPLAVCPVKVAGTVCSKNGEPGTCNARGSCVYDNPCAGGGACCDRVGGDPLPAGTRWARCHFGDEASVCDGVNADPPGPGADSDVAVPDRGPPWLIMPMVNRGGNFKGSDQCEASEHCNADGCCDTCTDYEVYHYPSTDCSSQFYNGGCSPAFDNDINKTADPVSKGQKELRRTKTREQCRRTCGQCSEAPATCEKYVVTSTSTSTSTSSTTSTSTTTSTTTSLLCTNSWTGVLCDTCDTDLYAADDIGDCGICAENLFKYPTCKTCSTGNGGLCNANNTKLATIVYGVPDPFAEPASDNGDDIVVVGLDCTGTEAMSCAECACFLTGSCSDELVAKCPGMVATCKLQHSARSSIVGAMKSVAENTHTDFFLWVIWGSHLLHAPPFVFFHFPTQLLHWLRSLRLLNMYDTK